MDLTAPNFIQCRQRGSFLRGCSSKESVGLTDPQTKLFPNRPFVHPLVPTRTSFEVEEVSFDFAEAVVPCSFGIERCSVSD